MLGAWFRLGVDMWMLGAESSSVIALRTLKLARGGTEAAAEAERMLQEKSGAALVRANRRRLNKQRPR